MGAGIAHDVFCEIVMYRDNGLFSGRSFSSKMDFLSFVCVLAESRIVHFENFLVW